MLPTTKVKPSNEQDFQVPTSDERVWDGGEGEDNVTVDVANYAEDWLVIGLFGMADWALSHSWWGVAGWEMKTLNYNGLAGSCHCPAKRGTMNMLACLSIPLLIDMDEVNIGGAHMGHVAEVEAVDGTTRTGEVEDCWAEYDNLRQMLVAHAEQDSDTMLGIRMKRGREPKLEKVFSWWCHIQWILHEFIHIIK